MGWNDHIDFELHEQVEQLVDEGMLEKGTAGYGIAQQVIHQGLESLSSKQRWVWDQIVSPLFEELEDMLHLRHAIEKD